MIYLELFLGFLRVGCFAFGGGYGAIPLIRDVVLSYGWLDDARLAQMIAVSESTPGPIMVNMATYVGTVQGGVLGAAVATFAVVLPAFVIVLLAAVALKKILSSPAVQAAMEGLRPCVVGVILATGIYMIVENCCGGLRAFSFDGKAAVLTVGLAATYYASGLVFKKGRSPIALIVFSALVGVIAYR